MINWLDKKTVIFLSLILAFSLGFISFHAFNVEAQDRPILLNTTDQAMDDDTGQHDIIIEDALNTIEKATPNGQDNTWAQGQLDIKSQDDALSWENSIIDEIDVTNQDIHTVLKTIALKGGLNIVIGQDIKAKVTIYLKDVYVWDALRIILDTNRLAYIKEKEIVRIITADEYKEKFGHPFGKKIQTKMVPLLYARASDMMNVLNEMKSDTGKVIFNDQTNTFVLIDSPDQLEVMDDFIKRLDVPIETVTIDLKYASADWVAKRVRELLTEGIGKVLADGDTNSIVLTDASVKVEEIRNFIERLDQPEKEILIEAKIIQIVLNDEHLTGVDWEAIVANYQGLEFLGLKNAVEAGPEGILKIGTITDEDYVVLLEALDTVGQISTIDNVKTTAFKNEPAGITIRSIKAIMLADEEEGENLQMGDEDVKLYLTLRGRVEDIYTLHLQPEIFGLAEKDTVVEVEDGATIVVGGMFRNVAVEITRKIPILGDLPFLGFAFRKGGQRTRTSEIIVFLTPRMIVSE